MKKFAEVQVEGLRKIFEKYKIHEKARILDLACGIGRISISLANHGYEVIGVDISPLFLELAEEWARKERLEDRTWFYRMDARDAAKKLQARKEKFDAITNFGTAMGYYGEEDDLRTFRGLRNIALSGALLVIETVNRDSLVKNFQPQSISQIGGMEMHENRRLNLETSFMENRWRFYRKNRGSLRLELDIPISHRIYSLHELKNLIERAGWRYLDSYGKLEGLAPVTTDSFHMEVVGQNPT